MSVAMIAWGARTNHRWIVPFAAGWASLALYEWTWLTMLLAGLALVDWPPRCRACRADRRDTGGYRVRILVTGAAGFINGYLVPELLEAGHDVIGLDDFSKYGRLTKSYDDHPRYRFVEGDAKDVGADARARRRLRPGRRRRGDDRRDQLLPRVRLRPAGRERADPRLDLRRGDRGPSRRPSRADHRRQQLDGLRVRDGLPDARGRPADVAAAGLDVRLPEARLGVLRQGRVGAVPAAVHDRAAVQLRRDRRAPGPARHRHHERQREARPVATSSRTSSSRSSRARTRCTSSATAIAGPALHVRRRPRPRDPPRDGVAGGDQRRLQPLDRGVDDRPRAGRGHLAQDPRPTAGRSATSATRPSSTTSSSASRTSARRREVLGFEATTTLDAMLDEVIPWIAAETEAGRL